MVTRKTLVGYIRCTRYKSILVSHVDHWNFCDNLVYVGILCGWLPLCILYIRIYLLQIQILVPVYRGDLVTNTAPQIPD
jgi:hypothetical protein